MTGANSENKSTNTHLKGGKHSSKKHFSSLAYTPKRCYSMSHRIHLFIILGYRYKSSYTYQEIRRIKEADLVFDRSDLFISTLDKKHELVPILMPDLSKYNIKKEEIPKIKKDIYGLEGWTIHNKLCVIGTFNSISKDPKVMTKIKRFIAKLEKNVVYMVLVLNIREENLFSFAKKSFYASRDTNPEFLLKHFLNQTSILVHKYGVSESVVQCFLASKP
jgi:hypothetical protein